jgi:hypothetical protein
MQKILVFTLSLLLLAGCTPAAESAYPNIETAPAYANPTVESGVEGQALIGPTCPVVREGDDCADKPYQTTLTIQNPQGELILQVQTDADGRFRVPLPSGMYILHPETTGRYPSTADQEFTVMAGQFTQIIVTYDSGIR